MKNINCILMTNFSDLSSEHYFSAPRFNMSKSRASKILHFRHYQTDAPI
ncbi:MAG: hypothetical protein V1779_02215 [bacterium]